MRNLVFVWWLEDGEALFMYYEEITGEWVLTRMSILVVQGDTLDLEAGLNDNSETLGAEVARDYSVGYLFNKAAGLSAKHEADATYEVISTCQADYNVSLN